MADSIPADELSNYETFRDCLSESVLKALAMPAEKPKPRKRRHAKKDSKAKIGLSVKSMEEPEVTSSADAHAADAEDLGDFIEVRPFFQSYKPTSDQHQFLTSLIFPSLPTDLRTLSYSIFRASPSLQERYSLPLSPSTSSPIINLIPPTAVETLSSYALLPHTSDTLDLQPFLLPILTTYITTTTAPPPIWSTTRTTSCELCNRYWVPLTYHHLIPRSTHDKVRKRGWHSEEMLGSVAWLCRACHSFVHGLCGNEELAREWYTVGLIREGGMDGERKGEVEGWVKWIGGVRWRKK